jgi:hypothetical protein
MTITLGCRGDLRYKHLVYGVRHFSYGISKEVKSKPDQEDNNKVYI